MQRGDFDTLPPPSGASVPNFGKPLSLGAALALARFGESGEWRPAQEPTERDLTWLEDGE